MKDKESLKNYFELMENKYMKEINATLIMHWVLDHKKKKKALCCKEFSVRNDKTRREII